MYPDILNELERAKDALVKKGTTIYIAGFKTFVTEKDSTAHEVLWNFFQREYPESKALKETVLRCFSDLDRDSAPPNVRSIPNLHCFGHVLYI